MKLQCATILSAAQTSYHKFQSCKAMTCLHSLCITLPDFKPKGRCDVHITNNTKKCKYHQWYLKILKDNKLRETPTYLKTTGLPC